MSQQRCAAPGCGRFVRRGARWCRAHDHAPAVEREIGDDARSVARRLAAEEFQRRLAQGDYQRLFDERLKEIIAQAAAERGLADEIGALRVVLARLLLEEDDLSKLVAGVARLAGVTVQAARAQRAIAGEVGDGLTEAINQFLAELDGA